MIKIVFMGEQAVAVKKKIVNELFCFLNTFTCPLKHVFFFMTTVLPYKEDFLIGITTLFWKNDFFLTISVVCNILLHGIYLQIISNQF